MTSTPTPPPNFSSIPAPRPAENNQNRNHHDSHKRHKNRRWSSSSKSASLAVVAAAEFGANGSAAIAGGVQSVGSGSDSSRAAYSSALDSLLDGRKSWLPPEFSGRKSTRFAAKRHSGMPRVTPNKHAHSNAADEALHYLFKAGNNIDAIDNVLIAYEYKLWEVEDYIYMLKEFGNTGHFLLAVKCFGFIMYKQNGRVAKGKLVSTMIGTLGKLGEINLASRLFESARLEGHGNTVYSFSAMISAYGRNGGFADAVNLFRSMSSWGLEPNLIMYNSLINAGAKGEADFDVVVEFYDEMKLRHINVDKVFYNTLVGIFSKLGRFDEAIDKCKEMERCGMKKDVVTYNALLSGYGKHGKYDEVRRLFEEMKTRNIYPNTLTYSTIIDMYTKGEMFQEAMDAYREFKMARLEVDVVFYSAIIDALCKNGLVESSIMLLIAMIEKGIKPNVVTFNSIVDASRQSPTLEYGVHCPSQAIEYPSEQSSFILIDDAFQNKTGDDRILKMFEQLAAEKAGHIKKDRRGRQDQHYILWLFRKMHELHIKPNVVTFSAILNACSRCNSIEDASKLLDALRLFDNQVYGVTHGLLMGYRQQVWSQAQTLFDEIMRMDSSTASAFYNAITDMLWQFGQRRGAEMVAIEGRQRNVWKGEWSISCLDLHLMSVGAACAMVHSWLLNLHSTLFEGSELPKIVSILTGWGKHSKVMGDGTLKKAVEALLNGMGSPFRIYENNLGRLVSPGESLAAWLRQPDIFDLLVLYDVLNHSQVAGPSHDYD